MVGLAENVAEIAKVTDPHDPVFNLKVGRYILCDRISRNQLTTFPLPERVEFTTQQMLSNEGQIYDHCVMGEIKTVSLTSFV